MRYAKIILGIALALSLSLSGCGALTTATGVYDNLTNKKDTVVYKVYIQHEVVVRIDSTKR